ncbi:MAG: ABC transporter permease subunit [Fibrobacter sp.]|nr:ABC transporter permease subunit [Fibrobacter sp.]
MIDFNGLKTVFTKEWKAFAGSDHSTFILYIILVVSWSFLIVNSDAQVNTGPLWLVFFSVIVAANFSNTVFISERVTGILEIFITSGISRDSILFGKMIFVFLMSSFMGILCILLGMLWQKSMPEFGVSSIGMYEIVIYLTSAVLNIGTSAFLSVKMANPRLLHFANILITAFVVVVYMIICQFLSLPEYLLPAVLVFTGSLLARREFNSERILQPIIF